MLKNILNIFKKEETFNYVIETINGEEKTQHKVSATSVAAAVTKLGNQGVDFFGYKLVGTDIEKEYNGTKELTLSEI